MKQDWIIPKDKNIVGIIYVILNHHPDANRQWYIGQKKLLKRVKRKPLKGYKRSRIEFVNNGVDEYWGSSKDLLMDIDKYGIEYFSRHVLEECGSKWEMNYAELWWQMNSDAIFDSRSYNGILSIRSPRPSKKITNKKRNIQKLLSLFKKIIKKPPISGGL